MSPDETLADPWKLIEDEPHDTVRTPDVPNVRGAVHGRDPVGDPVQPSDAAAQPRDVAAQPRDTVLQARDVVPPVRTIVGDRQPVPVAPPREREAIRAALAGAGPERLRLDDVSIYYGAKRAVNSVSLSIHQGEVLALIGPSGCGKTSLLRTLNRLTELTPSAARSGNVLLDGQDVHALRDTTLRSRVAMVFQQPNPFPMSIFDNVAFALREQSRKRPRRRELEPLVIDALRRAGLYEEVRDDLDRPALRLSGG